MFASRPVVSRNDVDHKAATRPLIWIVDDSALEAEAVRRALAPEFDLEVFHDGSAVLERSVQSPLPDVLVLDWLMPGVSGVEVCRFLRAKSDRLPVLLLTVQADKEHLAEGLAAGANDFVAKPFSTLELTARVRALLATRRLHERAERAERERAEAERLRADAAEERARLSELYLGIIGHDLRSPLAAISTSAALLLMRAQDASSRHLAERVRASSRRMSEMIGALLDLTRSRLGDGLSLQPKRSDLHRLCTQIVDELAGAYPGRRITIEAPPEPLELDLDPDRMGQVLSNLLSNAVLHGDDDGPVQLTLSRAGNEVVLCVRNQGRPMPRDILEHLFDPFRRGRTPERAVGLGLGLYITQEIVAAHGGTIEVTSGEVTTFTVRLPYK